MTTKVVSGTYPAGYYLKSPVTIASVTSTGYVKAKGIYTMADPPNTYTVFNDGTVLGGATGVYLGDGGLVTNGSASDTKALISANYAVQLQQAGTVVNFASIISASAVGFGIYCNEPGLVTNGSLQDTTATIQGAVGVLMPGDTGVAGTVDNFGVIEGSGTNSAGVLLTEESVLDNGARTDASARVSGDYGVKGVGHATVTNYGVIVGSGTESSAAGVYLENGGRVTNEAGAEILGTTGVLALNDAATVTNLGKITSAKDTSPGVGLREGGVVTNGSLSDTHAIIAGGRGVDVSGAAGTVTNFGTIAGAGRAGYYGAPQYAGVNLLGGGTLTNGATGDATALIEGYDGVLLAGSSRGTNLAEIETTGGYGAHLYNAAVLTNGASGDSAALISGWVGVELYNTATLDSFGVVSGAGGTAVFLYDPDTRLDAEAGSKFEGEIDANDGLVDFVSGISTASGIQSRGVVEGVGTASLDGGASSFRSGIKLQVAQIDVAGASTSVEIATNINFAKVWDQSGGTLTVDKGDELSLTGSANSFAGTLAGLGELEVDGGRLTIGAAGAILTGGGVLGLANLSTSTVVGASSAATLTNVNDKITGAGQLGDGDMKLVNEAGGVINGDETVTLVIDTGANTIANAGNIDSSSTGGVKISSALANTGLLVVAGGGTLDVTGAVSGTGSVRISDGTAEFGSTFAQNVDWTGVPGVLELAKSQTYTGKVTGFSTTGGTSFDLLDIAFGGSTTAKFTGSTTSGVLTVTDGTHTAKITLEGNYTTSKFTASSDGHGGTKVVDPTPKVAAHLAPPAPLNGFVAAMAAFGTAEGPIHPAADVWRETAPLVLTSPRMVQAM